MILRKVLLFIIFALCTMTFAQATNRAAAPDSLAADSLPPLEKMPELLLFVKAEYPAELVKKGIEGSVVLELLVTDSGKVDSVTVVKSLTPVLDTCAINAVRRFTFKPAIAQGAPVPVIVQYEYRFTIAEVTEKIEKYSNFKGKILERGTRAPVADAMVILSFSDTAADTSLKVPFSAYLKKIGSFEGQSVQEKSLVSTTDSAGNFTFYSLPLGTVHIKVVVPDFEPFFDQQTIKYGQATDVIYRMDRIANGNNEIVVYGKVEKKEVAQRTLTLNEVRKVPGLGGDAVKVVQAMPGVARPFFGTGELIVRGANQGDNQYFLDGVRVPSVFHFGGVKSSYNSDALSAIDFYPGGFGVRYGNALGGVIEIKGRSPKTDRWHGYTDLNFFDASFLYEMPVTKKTSFLLTARRSYIANMLNFVVKDVLKQEMPFTVVPYYWDYVLRVDTEPNKKNHFFITLFGTKDQLELISPDTRGGSTDISEDKSKISTDQQFNIQMLGWNADVTSRIHNELRYALYVSTQKLSILGFFKQDVKGVQHFIRNQTDFTLQPGLTVHIGEDISLWPSKVIVAAPNDSGTVSSDTTNYFYGPFGIYSSFEWKPLNGLTLTPGLRYDYYPELSYNGATIPQFGEYGSSRFLYNRFSGDPSLRLSARYSLVKDHALKGSIGSYNQSPQPMGQVIHPIWGNPYLPATRGSQYVLGYEWQITDLINLDLQGYYNKQWDVPRLRVNSDVLTGEKPYYLGDGKARMTGLELMLRHDQGKRFFGWIAYSLARSERYDFNEKQWVLFDRDITNNLQLVGSVRLHHGMEIGARLRYVDGYPTTPVIGLNYYDATNNYYVPLYGKPLSARMIPYIGFDLRFEKRFTFDKWMASMYVEAVNLVHYLRFINKANGEPLYEPPETGFYMYNYDYNLKSSIADVPRVSVGIRTDF